MSKHAYQAKFWDSSSIITQGGEKYLSKRSHGQSANWKLTIENQRMLIRPGSNKKMM